MGRGREPFGFGPSLFSFLSSWKAFMTDSSIHSECQAALSAPERPDLGVGLPARGKEPQEDSAWEREKMKVAELLGWKNETRAKQRHPRIAADFEEWIRVRRVGGGGRPVFERTEAPGPGALEESARLALQALWEALCELAWREAEALANQPAGPGSVGVEKKAALVSSHPKQKPPEGLGVVAPGGEGRVLLAQKAIQDAIGAGLSPGQVFSVCAKSVCQAAEVAFWRLGLRAQGGHAALDSMLWLFYSVEDDEPEWASCWACWDAEDWGRASAVHHDPDVLKSPASMYLEMMEMPWDASQGSRAEELRAKSDGVWGSEWMKMAIAAGRAKRDGWEGFEASVWQSIVTADYGANKRYWEYAAGKGIDPTVKGPRGLNAMDWLLEPMSEQGAAGEFVLLDEEKTRLLLKLAPDFNWITPSRPFPNDSGFERALRRVTAPGALDEIRFCHGLAVAASEEREIKKSAGLLADPESLATSVARRPARSL